MQTRLYMAGITVLLMSLAASAQQEQWLEYHSASSSQETGAVVGQHPRLTATRPADLGLPTFHSDKPLFARLILESDTTASQPASSGRWMALDQSRKGGPYDTLYIDANGNGSLADEKPVASVPTNDTSYAQFERVRIDVPGPEGPVAYHLNVFASGIGVSVPMRITPAGWYSGQVKLGDHAYWCVLVDSNANGRFDDFSLDARQCDYLCLYPLKPGTKQYPFRDEARHYVGQYVQVDDGLYRLGIASDGSSVTFESASWPQRHAAKVSPALTQLSVWSKLGQFNCVPKDGSVLLPAGEYALDGWLVEKQDSGVQWKLTGRWPAGGSPTFKAGGESETSISAGEPVFVQFQDDAEGPVHHIAPLIHGPLNSQLMIMQGSALMRISSLRITADGGYDKIVGMEYG